MTDTSHRSHEVTRLGGRGKAEMVGGGAPVDGRSPDTTAAVRQYGITEPVARDKDH